MARSFLTPINMNGLEILNVRAQQLASAPSSPTLGTFYFDTGLGQLGVYSGTGWLYLSPATTSYTDEQAQDAVAALIAAGTQTGITVTYNDAANTLSFTVASDAVAGTASLRTLGTGAQQAAAGNDSRLSDTRTPTDGTVTTAKIASGGITPASITGTAVITSDTRLSDTRTPSASSIVDSMVSGSAAINVDKTANGTTNKVYTATEQTKLAGIATGATNYTNATALANRLDQFAAPTASVSLNSQKITNLLDPTSAQDAATKGYVDATAVGLDVKPSVRVATTANITLSGTQTIDGVAVIAGDRVLVKNQTTASGNGIYVVAAGAWSRSTDADTSAEVTGGMFTFVNEGTVNADTGWVLTTNDAITLGTTSLTFAQFSGAGTYTAGNGLTLTGTSFAVNPAASGGISVSGSGVAIDTSVVVRKYATAIGDNSTTSIVVTHNLGTQDVQVRVYRATTPWDMVEPDIQHTSTNTVTVIFATAPTTGQYRVVVQG